MDNASYNDRLIKVVTQALEKDELYYNYHQRRLQCNSHIINLAVQAFLLGKVVEDYEYPDTLRSAPNNKQIDQWRKLGPLGKLHNIIIWIMESTQRIQAFKKLSNSCMPHRDNGTRQNSWYDILDWGIEKIKPAIVSLSNEEADLSNDLLSAEDRKTLVYIRNFLKSFYDATKISEGQEATLDRVLPTMDFLIQHFENSVIEYAQHEFMRGSIQTGYTKMLQYWNKTQKLPAYIAAIVLDPTTKYTYFDDWDPEWQPNIKLAMRSFWEKTYCSSTGLIWHDSLAAAPESGNKFIERMHKKKDRN